MIYRAVKFCLKSGLNNSYFDRSGRNHSKAIHASFKAKRKKKRSKKRKQYSRRTGFWLLFSSTFCILRTRKMQTCACPAKAERSRQDNKEGNYESDSCSGFFPLFFFLFYFQILCTCAQDSLFFFADSNTLTPISRPLAASPSRTCTVACKINSFNINSKPARNQCNLLCFIVRLFPVMLNGF